MVSKILFLLLNELEVIRQLILVLKFFSVRTVSSLKDAMWLSDSSFTPCNYGRLSSKYRLDILEIQTIVFLQWLHLSLCLGYNLEAKLGHTFITT